MHSNLIFGGILIKSTQIFSKDQKANTNVIGTIVSLAIMLMVGVLLLGQFQQQADSQMDEIGDPATNLITATSLVKDTWISLSYSPLVIDSESVTNGTTTYTKSTDYAMGYGNGTILIYATGSIANDTMLSVEYDHKAGTTHDAYDNVKNSSWGAMNLMGMYPWILGAVALLSVVVLIGRRD